MTFTPGTVMAANMLTAQCEMTCDMEKSCEIEDMTCCPRSLCNAGQCCYCGFVCPVDTKQIEICVFESSVDNKMVEEDFLLPGFSSELLQPPKV